MKRDIKTVSVILEKSGTQNCSFCKPKIAKFAKSNILNSIFHCYCVYFSPSIPFFSFLAFLSYFLLFFISFSLNLPPLDHSISLKLQTLPPWIVSLNALCVCVCLIPPVTSFSVYGMRWRSAWDNKEKKLIPPSPLSFPWVHTVCECVNVWFVGWQRMKVWEDKK